MDYNEKIVALKEKYKDRILRIMRNIAEAIRAEGWECEEPADFADNEFTWRMLAKPKGAEDEDGTDLSFEIAEQRYYEGGDEDGLTFRLDITRYGGEIVGGLCPYNYTERCWIPIDEGERIEERFCIFEADHIPAEAAALTVKDR